MNKYRPYIVLAVIVAMAAGIYFLFQGDEAEQKGAAPDDAIVTFSNMDMREEAKGQVVWYLKAANVKIDADKDTAHLKNVEGYFKNDQGELTIKADTGTVHGTTKDGAVLDADNLKYDGKTQILSTDKQFTLVKDGKVLTADTFTADRVLQVVTAKGHASLKEKGK